MEDQRDTRKLLWLALGLGLVLRTVCAYFVYGPQSLDDYRHGIWPAQQLLFGETPSLPDYRSYLLPWILNLFLQIGQLFGIQSALSQVRWAYFCLGLISLLTIYAMHLIYKAEEYKKYVTAIALAAVFPLFVFIGTRSFGEAVALSLVTLGLAWIDQAEKNKNIKTLVQGLLVLGIAVLLRFHIGLIYLTATVWFFARKNRQFFLWSCGVGVLLILAQSSIDLLSGKYPFQTLVAYLKINQDGATGYGVSPWYNTISFVLALCLFPFSGPYFQAVKKAWQRFPMPIIGLGIFVFVHSIVPHKEERFMYPIVGLLATLMVWMFFESKFYQAKYTRVFFKPFVAVMTVLGLLAVCFNNSLVGEIEPAATSTRKYPKVLFVETESLLAKSFFKDFFVRSPHNLKTIEDSGAFKATELTAEPVVVLLTSSADKLLDLERWRNELAPTHACSELKTATSFLDEWIYEMNPQNNKRRRPSWYYECVTSSTQAQN